MHNPVSRLTMACEEWNIYTVVLQPTLAWISLWSDKCHNDYNVPHLWCWVTTGEHRREQRAQCEFYFLGKRHVDKWFSLTITSENNLFDYADVFGHARIVLVAAGLASIFKDISRQYIFRWFLAVLSITLFSHNDVLSFKVSVEVKVPLKVSLCCPNQWGLKDIT